MNNTSVRRWRPAAKQNAKGLLVEGDRRNAASALLCSKSFVWKEVPSVNGVLLAPDADGSRGRTERDLRRRRSFWSGASGFQSSAPGCPFSFLSLAYLSQTLLRSKGMRMILSAGRLSPPVVCRLSFLFVFLATGDLGPSAVCPFHWGPEPVGSVPFCRCSSSLPVRRTIAFA